MKTTIEIGTWHEQSSQITRCPSYYAADTETLQTKTGDYPARLTFEGGYLVPMPYWLLVGIDAERISGRLYSGFGGHNFASTELVSGESVTYHIQMYHYQIAELVAAGRLTLHPGFEWLLGGPGDAVWRRPEAPKTWEQVESLSAAVR